EQNPWNKIDFLNDSVGVATASGDETAYITSDGGEHWSLLYFSTFLYYTSACYSKAGARFVAGYQEWPSYYPYILSEQGWEDNFYYSDCVPADIASFENSRVYCVGQCGHIVYTEDDGYVWKDTLLTNYYDN